MSNLIECVSGRIDELNGKFKDIILSSRDMFAGLPFVPMEHKDAIRKTTTIVKDIEFGRGRTVDLDTFLSFFDDDALNVVKLIHRQITTSCGFPPQMKSLWSICEERKLVMQKPVTYSDTCIEMLQNCDFIVMSGDTWNKHFTSLKREVNIGASLFINEWAGSSVYGGLWYDDSKNGIAIIYPKDAMTNVKLLEDKETGEPIVRLTAYLNLAMFGERNIFRMDGF